MRGEREVKIFSAAMLQKLAERAHHGDWKGIDVQTLRAWLDREVEEFTGALWQCLIHGGSPEDVLREGADIANIVMFLCDHAGALKEEE